MTPTSPERMTPVTKRRRASGVYTAMSANSEIRKAAAEVLARDDPNFSVMYWHTLSGTLPHLPTVDMGALPRKFREYLESGE